MADDHVETRSEFSVVAGDLYARWTLDALVEVANYVSRDFFARPEFYKADVDSVIVDLRMDYGTKCYPDGAQRTEMCTPIFGISDGAVQAVAADDKFRSLRKPLLDACIRFSERSIVDATAGIEQAIWSALALFQTYLQTFDGTSSRATHEQISSASDSAYRVLTSTGVAQVFGVIQPPAADSGWPLTSDDPNGALVIRSIGQQLRMPPELIFTDEKFQRLRRVAQQGNAAVTAIVQARPGSDGDFKNLVIAVYSWAVALRDYGIIL